MSVLVAVAIAAVVVTLVVTIVTRVSRTADPADVRASTAVIAHEARVHPRLREFLRRRSDRTKATGLALTVSLSLAAGAIVIIGSVLEMVRRDRGFARWDRAAAQWGAEHSTETSRDVLRAITWFGATSTVIGIALVVSVFEYRRLKSRAVPAFLVAVVGSALLLNNAVKLIVGRARPDFNQFVEPSGSSFPSGHTAAAAATFAAIALVVGRQRGRTTRAVLAGAAGGIVVAVATSRVLLGVHWVTDVIAGAFLGWACFALCSIAFGGRLLRFGQPVAAVAAAADAAASQPATVQPRIPESVT